MAPVESRADSFPQYRSMAEKLMRKMANGFSPGSLDEQAVPAYTSGNALSRWVFWRRPALLFKRLGREQGRAALDFGCGTGIMVPWLTRRYDKVYAVDPVTEPLERFLKSWRRETGESLNNVAIHHDLPSLDNFSLDLILALDSLEHVQDPALIAKRFYGLLKTGGRLVVSGPTENAAYRLGRRITGFTGEYHHRTIYDVEKVLGDLFMRRHLFRILFPITLFRITVYEKGG